MTIATSNGVLMTNGNATRTSAIDTSRDVQCVSRGAKVIAAFTNSKASKGASDDFRILSCTNIGSTLRDLPTTFNTPSSIYISGSNAMCMLSQQGGYMGGVAAMRG